MYWKPVIVGLGGLAGVHASSAVEVEQRAIGDVLAGAPISDISVTASDLAQCGEATVSWTGTVPPVSLMVGTGGYYANLQQLQTIDNLDGSSTQVQIDQKEGTDMIFQITDANGQVGYVQNLKVGGGDSSCLNDGGSTSGGEASSSSSGGAAAPSVVQSSSSTWSEAEASSSEASAPESSADRAPSSSSSVAPTQSPSASSSSSGVSTSASASRSASVSSVSAAGASASSSSSAGTVDASAANAPNGAAGLVVPGLTAAVGLVVGAAAIL